METIPMDSTILGIILGAVASGFVALLIAFVSKTRGQDKQELRFVEMLRTVRDENRKAMEAVKLRSPSFATP